jgi:hypothetical protein
MKEHIVLKKITPFEQLKEQLKKVTFRMLFDKDGGSLFPYKDASFTLATIYPAKKLGESPTIVVNGKRHPLFTSQPTIYQNQIDIMNTVDVFLKKHRISIHNLKNGVEYSWEGRGDFHILPPIIEKHTYDLREGYIDIDKMKSRFTNTYTTDARENLHHLGDRFLSSFYIDEVSKLDYIDIFNSNTSLVNYGTQQHGKKDFHIICDGSHRIDYALEKLKKPITVILAEAKSSKKPLVPYYALPVSFTPTIRLSSKKAERMHTKIERDKIHLLNDFIKKHLHYNWEKAELNVSKLRSNL